MTLAHSSFRLSMYMLAVLPATIRAFIGIRAPLRFSTVTSRAPVLLLQKSRGDGARFQTSFSVSALFSTTGPVVQNERPPRREKRPRSKPETTTEFIRPVSVTPMKFANVKPCEISQVPELAFDMIIDVRTPAEFEIDHIPGSVNYPVLDNDERIIIGTLHNGNVFEARRRGAALISRHVADLLENEFKHQPKTWRPLIVCWRGGLRSGSLAMVLAQVGWQVHQLTGGYKAYRKELMEVLPVLCEKSIFKIISAPTGSGKTHFLGALKRAGHQVIDLEGLANHRGSVLGNVPGSKQPSQRLFDTRLLLALKQLDLSKPIYLESESRKIGSVALPDVLYKRMHQSECLFLDVPKSERVKGLLIDYIYFIENPKELMIQLGFLAEYRGVEKLKEWDNLVQDKNFSELVFQLLDLHYDPLYWKSLRKNYPHIDNRELTQQLVVTNLSSSSLDEAVTRIENMNFKYPIDNISLLSDDNFENNEDESDSDRKNIEVEVEVEGDSNDLDIFG